MENQQGRLLLPCWMLLGAPGSVLGWPGLVPEDPGVIRHPCCPILDRPERRSHAPGTSSGPLGSSAFARRGDEKHSCGPTGSPGALRKASRAIPGSSQTTLGCSSAPPSPSARYRSIGDMPLEHHPGLQIHAPSSGKQLKAESSLVRDMECRIHAPGRRSLVTRRRRTETIMLRNRSP